MKKKGEKRRVRNGKVYVGAWIKKEIIDEAKRQAKIDCRTLAGYIEMALGNHNYHNLN